MSGPPQKDYDKIVGKQLLAREEFTKQQDDTEIRKQKDDNPDAADIGTFLEQRRTRRCRQRVRVEFGQQIVQQRAAVDIGTGAFAENQTAVDEPLHRFEYLILNVAHARWKRGDPHVFMAVSPSACWLHMV